LPSTICGNQYIANYVPLTEGLNTITATATDFAGNTATTSGGGKFQRPEGIAVDLSGNFYVADRDNHRIQKFSLVSPQPAAPTALTATRSSSSSMEVPPNS
jgi:DNA-binding beta-propeller fold protein YncE